MPTVVPAARTSSTSRSATAARSSSGTRSNASARTWLAWVWTASVPSSPMNSRCHASRAAVGERSVALDALAWPPEHVGDPRHRRRRAMQVGGGDLRLVGGGESAEVGDLEAGLEPFAPVEAGVPQVALVRRRWAARPRGAGDRAVACRALAERRPSAAIASQDSASGVASPYASYSAHGAQHDRHRPSRPSPGAPAVGPCEALGRRRRGDGWRPGRRRAGRADIRQPLAGERRRRRRGTQRSGRRSASRRSTRRARGAGSRSGSRRCCRGGSTPPRRGAG